ncbi:MAG: hypothetical protein ABSE45_01905 [Candidatus Acidiferrales bacterium]|jgi:hypothetical protein
MFEEIQEEEKQSSSRGIIIVIAIVVVLAIVGALVYMDSKGMFKSSSESKAPSTTSATALPAGAANAAAVKDLHILSTKMDKDYTGTTAVWLVDVKNESSSLTYSHIMYQTTYGGADNSVLGQNSGEIPSLSLGPGEEQSAQFKDAAYPSATAWFKVTITGAAATQ